MNEFITAIIALIGTLFTIIIGYWQWKRQPENFLRQNFQGDRQIAYKKLWSLLPSKDMIGINKEIDKDELKLILLEIEDFSVKNELYLEEKYVKLTIDYIQELIDFHDFRENIKKELNSIFLETRGVKRDIPQAKKLKSPIAKFGYIVVKNFIHRIYSFWLENFGSIPNLPQWVVSMFLVSPQGRLRYKVKEISTSFVKLGKTRKSLAMTFKKAIGG